MDWYQILIWLQLFLCPIVFFSLMFVSAPYGRHNREGWGFTLDTKRAWILMEFPAVATILLIFLINFQDLHPVNYIFILLWEFHYLYRTFYFPLQLKQSKKSFPVLIVLFAILFNVLNGFINGSFAFKYGALNSWEEINTTHFWIGLILFFTGFCMHYLSDKTILNLRNESQAEYSIPQGGMFKYVTNPNYLGEFIQWTGWAILCWSMAGLAFALFTLCNLLPRAVTNHKWYQAKFKDYPKKRKRFFPFIY
jgi:protein-S-isoprenylcysteine O-methyltransferase Ste14